MQSWEDEPFVMPISQAPPTKGWIWADRLQWFCYGVMFIALLDLVF